MRSHTINQNFYVIYEMRVYRFSSLSNSSLFKIIYSIWKKEDLRSREKRSLTKLHGLQRRRMELGVEQVAEWMRSNRLCLNSEKTEFLWCATSRRCPHL